ncbi:alpha/beta hydrolase [Paludisphaera mucosa]|uniref:Alpha/beta hydrolase-fold protein n=1 Tax=Paludisphaera mucosa TaxID=3030827 RepID=A0ABT6FF38_9BACT|nr:alpha/beta hydrolase-fold protein [Paludisphaera mucosa]MDG3006109.1 alpha/beta hydrolase-fold protein [Paludisphaera mucosa]
MTLFLSVVGAAAVAAVSWMGEAEPVDGTEEIKALMRAGRSTLDGSEGDGGRLSARPGRLTEAAAAGLHRLGMDEIRDGLLYVPVGYRPKRPAPLVVVLHGARGDAKDGIALLRGQADDAGLILLAPSSRGRTWDAILGSFGPDVEVIQQSLAQTFGRCSVDPDRVVVCGFSDGASYALSLGLTNGDLFTRVIAFSPGFMAPGKRHGRPRIYLSHGTNDSVLPMERCSRVILPKLRDAGYEVAYREFVGPHSVPDEIAREAATWLFTR